MAINKKLIHFETLTKFQSADGINTTSATQSADANQLVGNIPYHSIVFIKDVCKFWTHGKYYDCNNTWRGIQNNLTSTSTTDSLSAYQGKILNEKFANYLPLSGGTLTGALSVPSLTVTGASTFSQAINGSILGNAATASRLQNARTITIGSQSNSFDGSANISYSLASMGAFASSSFTQANIKSTLGISDWALASSKPSYNFSEIGVGTAVIGDGANYLLWRSDASWRSGVYYHTTGDEAVVFANTYGSRTSWIFATTDPVNRANWTTLTPSMQIKNGKVAINKLIANGTNLTYALEVNGDVQATNFRGNLVGNASTVTNGVYTTGNQTISGNKTFSGSTSLDDTTIGNLVVTGGASFAQTINGNIISADKVNHSLIIQLNSGTTEGTNKFTFNGSANKSINITPNSIGAQASGNYKTKQTAVETVGASTNTLTFINSISQDTNGVITATTGVVRDASTSVAGVVNIGAQSFAGAKTFANNLTVGSTSTNANLEVHGTTTLGNSAFGAQLEIWRKEPYYSAIKFANGSNKTTLGYIGFTYDGDSTIGSILPVWIESDITKKHKITYVDTDSTTAVGGTTIPVYVDTNGQIKAGTALGTASTHAHSDYVTSITYDSTNKKLQQSKGGGTATDIVTFGSHAFDSTAYLPTSGGTLSNTIPNILTLKRTDSGGGAFVDYYHAGQTTHYWRGGSNQAGVFTFYYDGSTETLAFTDSAISYKQNTIYHAGNLSIGTLMGSTAIGDSDEPVYWSGTAFVKAGAYPTKASWNYDDVYLKLSGGKLSSNTWGSQLQINRNQSGGDSVIKYSTVDTVVGYMGFTSSGTAIIYNGSGANQYTIYHTGNLSPMTTSHAANDITSTKISNWDAVYTWYTTAAGTSASGVIDNWNEIKNFIDGFHESDDLAEYLVNTFVAKTGGTMTGALTTPGLTVTGAATFSQAINGSILGNAATADKVNHTLTFTGYSTGTFDGSADKSIAIPSNTNQLTNGAGFITSSSNITGTAAGITGYTFKTSTSKSTSGWTNNTTDDKIIPTMSFIAYWNGAYSGTSSNLTYCNQGAFGTATTHAHTDYVTSLSWDSDNNKLAWSKGGTAQTAITIGYATNANYAASAGNADTVDGYHISDDYNLPYKNVTNLTCAYSSITEDYWYVKILISYSYQGIVNQKMHLVADYSNFMTKAELQVYGYYLGYKYSASRYNADTIVGIASTRQTASQVIWLKMKKPTEYNGSIPNGSISIYSNYISSAEVITSAPSGVTFTDTLQSDGQHILSGYIKAAGFIGNATSATNATNDSDGNAINTTYLKLSGGTLTGAFTVPSISVTGAATFSQAINGSILGNAATASRLQNARTISLSGSVTGSGSFDGSGNLSIATTTNHSHSYVNTIGISGSKLTWSINGTAQTDIQLPTYTNNVTSHLRAGVQNGTANSNSATSDPYLLLVEGSTLDSQIQLKASTGISISANGGIVTITNTSTNSHTYTSSWTSKTDNNNYPIAFSPNATPTTSGNGYNANFTFNPSTKTFNNNGSKQVYDSTNKVLKFIFD